MKTFLTSTSFLFTLFLFSISCSSLRDIDKPVCIELSLSEAHCTYIISGKSFTWNDEELYLGKTWFESRAYNIQVPVDTWKAFKTYIQKQCRKRRNCAIGPILKIDGDVKDNLLQRPSSYTEEWH